MPNKTTKKIKVRTSQSDGLLVFCGWKVLMDQQKEFSVAEARAWDSDQQDLWASWACWGLGFVAWVLQDADGGVAAYGSTGQRGAGRRGAGAGNWSAERADESAGNGEQTTLDLVDYQSAGNGVIFVYLNREIEIWTEISIEIRAKIPIKILIKMTFWVYLCNFSVLSVMTEFDMSLLISISSSLTWCIPIVHLSFPILIST